MKWLQDNPLGMVMIAICGVFALLVLVMTIVWNLPVSLDTAGAVSEIDPGDQTSLSIHEIGKLEDYKVVNEKPVFNQSRLPVIEELDELQEEDATIEVRDAPDVTLTGVVITPNRKIASLTPADRNLETVMAYEGESLTGEFVGWRVTAVNPRTVMLESRDGQSLELDLLVHYSKIQEPPTPVSQSSAAQAVTGQGEESDDPDDEPLSRAEQIRQRIAERREELRLEQELQQSQNGAQPKSANAGANPSEYQSAIRTLMKNKSKDQGSNEKNDG